MDAAVTRVYLLGMHGRLVVAASVLPLGIAVVLSACGGGNGSSGEPGVSDELAARIAAASTAAQTNPDCTRIGAFYWEIGDKDATLASGSIGGSAYRADTPMSIASASKWLYSSYWVQRQKGVLTADDVKFFNFRSGYTQFSSCVGSLTVGACLDLGTNGVFDPATEGFFEYGGGHMQKHATLNGLGPLTPSQLTAEVLSQLGTEIDDQRRCPDSSKIRLIYQLAACPRLSDEAVAQAMISGSLDLELGGEVKDATILFCDIRGFTAMTEEMSPTEVIAILNLHMTAMTEITREHHGVVDKFIGDAIMAVFGCLKS
jgi:hypothetical protein